MRTAMRLMAFTLFALPAHAQEAARPADCYPTAVTGLVEVTRQTGPAQKATLLCIGGSQVLLAADGRVDAVPLDDVKTIVKPADSIADGFLKGAAIAALFGVLCHECGDAGEWASVVLTYGVVGAVIDASHGGRETLYRSRGRGRSAPVTVAWRLRF